ncbi:alpha/beta hydrolase [Patescibacteria group bacterium]|nr:alpha/beta hydrolase [Patescibacteria group bacterium]
MDYSDNFFEADSIQLKYLTAGKGRPLLFLHGGGVNALTYKKNLELLSRKYHIIAPDIPCFGKSSIPNKLWDFKDYATFFSKFIATLSLDNIILVGHSFGGGIALNLALQNKKITKLILLDSAGIPPSYSALKMVSLLVIKTFRGLLLFENKLISLILLRDFATQLFRNFFSIHKIYRIVTNSFFREYDAFNKISQPTYIFWGNSDEIFSKNIAQKMNQLISNSRLEFVDGNHDWCLLMPQKLYNLICKVAP